MVRVKHYCPKCGRGTTKKAISLYDMCPRCYRIWQRVSYDEAVAGLSREILGEIRTLAWEGLNYGRIVARMKREHPDIGREWDVAIVALAHTKAEMEGIKPKSAEVRR